MARENGESALNFLNIIIYFFYYYIRTTYDEYLRTNNYLVLLVRKYDTYYRRVPRTFVRTRSRPPSTVGVVLRIRSTDCLYEVVLRIRTYLLSKILVRTYSTGRIELFSTVQLPTRMYYVKSGRHPDN